MTAAKDLVGRRNPCAGPTGGTLTVDEARTAVRIHRDHPTRLCPMHQQAVDVLRCAGEYKEVQLNQLQMHLLGALDAETPTALSDILETTKARYDSTRLVLARLAEDGLCEKVFDGETAKWLLTEAGERAMNAKRGGGAR